MDDTRPIWERTAHFVNRESGIMSRVTKVDDSFAYIEVLAVNPSGWAMPVRDYDERFARQHKPVDMGQMKVPDKYRPPADVKPWMPEPPEPPADERGEGPEGVRIEAPFTWREPND